MNFLFYNKTQKLNRKRKNINLHIDVKKNF